MEIVFPPEGCKDVNDFLIEQKRSMLNSGEFEQSDVELSFSPGRVLVLDNPIYGHRRPVFACMRRFGDFLVLLGQKIHPPLRGLNAVWWRVLDLSQIAIPYPKVKIIFKKQNKVII